MTMKIWPQWLGNISRKNPGIYIFQPEITAFSHIRVVSPSLDEQIPRSPTGLLASHCYKQGKAVPPECIQRELVLAQEDMVMPDFFYLRHCEIVVSNRAKAVLDELVPGAIEYIEMKMHIAPSMKPAEAYYYINVSPTARRIDWNATEIPLTKRFVYLTAEGILDHSGPREMRDVYRANPGMPGVVFRALCSGREEKQILSFGTNLMSMIFLRRTRDMS
jgi:hypothetical protein